VTFVFVVFATALFAQVAKPLQFREESFFLGAVKENG
jgi:hypothetical protein